jgi:hypothetical protein
MALAAHRAGTIFKKCDRSNHKPDSDKRCASATCQHTCGNPGRCACLDPHYLVFNKQHGKSFRGTGSALVGRVGQAYPVAARALGPVQGLVR